MDGDGIKPACRWDAIRKCHIGTVPASDNSITFLLHRVYAFQRIIVNSNSFTSRYN